ncbi:MAG: hypothetical protein ACE1Y4_04685, partial [Lysobacterales bacterium]
MLALTGCGGSGGGDGAGGPQSLEGVWTGSRTYTVFICIIFICVADHEKTTPAMALATSDGTIHLLPWDAVNSASPPGLLSWQLAGKVQVTGSALTGTLRRTCDPLDGPPLFGHVAVQGSVARRATLDVEYELDECLGRGIFNLDFDMVSDRSASLAIVAGQWSATTVALSVGDDGAYTGATGTGCQLSGFITPASASFNVYEIDITVENCSSNDGSYPGLATVLPDQFG